MSCTAVLIHIVSVMSIPNLINSTPCLVNSYKSTSSPLSAIPDLNSLCNSKSVRASGSVQHFSLPLRIRHFSQLRVISSHFFSAALLRKSFTNLRATYLAPVAQIRSIPARASRSQSIPIHCCSIRLHLALCPFFSFPNQFSANRSILIHSKSSPPTLRCSGSFPHFHIHHI